MNERSYGITEKTISIWMRINEILREQELQSENERVQMTVSKN